ncbi:MAG: hypothetical protein ACOX5W_07930 [Bacillota bacterium]|jgi:hypothetical protein
MYSTLPNFVLGFHGCDLTVYNRIIYLNERLTKSQNSYDWLGHGIYFWENNPNRAFEYAEELKHRGKIKDVAVIGAIIDLGYCLNLMEYNSLQILKRGYKILKEAIDKTGGKLPENKRVGSSTDLLLRHLDCAVIEMVHAFNKDEGHREYDSVRGLFIEGDELYPNAGFREKNHIQICVRNPNCIKGYFSPLDPIEDFHIP